jgi:hypothetical protein
MFRRIRLIVLNALGRGYPPIIYIEPGEDPTKDRREMISAMDTGRIVTIVVLLLAICPLSYAGSKIFFKPKEVAAAAESTAEATLEMSQEPEQTAEPSQEPTAEPSATPIVIVITATPTPTFTPTFTPTPTHTFTPTATAGPGELWPVWMTATQFQKDFFGQNQEATDLPYWRIRIVTATATTEPE